MTLKQTMKAQLTEAAATGSSTQQVVYGNLALVEPGVRHAMGNVNSLKRSCNRYIAQGRPRNPAVLDQLEISGIWANDIDGNPFLIEDNHNDENTVQVFANENCLSHLSMSLP